LIKQLDYLYLCAQVLGARDLGISRMRMLPKLNGMRPIVNLSKATRIRVRVPGMVSVNGMRPIVNLSKATRIRVRVPGMVSVNGMRPIVNLCASL